MVGSIGVHARSKMGFGMWKWKQKQKRKWWVQLDSARGVIVEAHDWQVAGKRLMFVIDGKRIAMFMRWEHFVLETP